MQQPGRDLAGTGGARPGPTASSTPTTDRPRKRKGHRAGKKRRHRRKSFAAPLDEMADDGLQPGGLDQARDDFYSVRDGNLSNTSIDSETLLDHRDQQHSLRPRRPSLIPQTSPSQHRHTPLPSSRLGSAYRGVESDNEGDGEEMALSDEGAPLLSSSTRLRSEPVLPTAGYGSTEVRQRPRPRSRRDSSQASSKRRRANLSMTDNPSYNVNYPPSVPGTPPVRPAHHRMSVSLGDVMLHEELDSDQHSAASSLPDLDITRAGPGQGFQAPPLDRRHTIALQAEEDVCFPQEGLSEIADDESRARDPTASRARGRRRRAKWPDLSILEEWSSFEKEGRSEGRRAKKITEPQLINGRLRPVHKGWSLTEDASPYRFTYFNDQFQSTIHSQTISELVQPGGSFKELFIPEPLVLSDSSEEDEEEEESRAATLHQVLTGQDADPMTTTARQLSVAALSEGHPGSRRQSIACPGAEAKAVPLSGHGTDENGQARAKVQEQVPSPPAAAADKPPRYGERPVWWLDVLSPTEAEMKVLSKAFGIHPLTSEDIMVQEPREKVELFRHYYFVNYRTFEQDRSSENFLEPVNMYIVVFREGVLTFHFSTTPHPANVRRRIRQLRDYLILTSDWISYAIIDDITDVFVPLIQDVEDEVDDIDDAVLELSSSEQAPKDKSRREGERSDTDASGGERGGDMLRRVGDCRKKVMSLYRLLSNKADVIKGFAKRYNAHVEVAPRSEIGLYLGDIQDHIVTMTGNLSHYEKILARCHANYIAHINIRMNERQEQTADVLGKLTVLGTIVLPMNIITGLWGMNVWVPGQEHEGDLTWFVAITGGLFLFGLACYLIAKRVYRIV